MFEVCIDKHKRTFNVMKIQYTYKSYTTTRTHICLKNKKCRYQAIEQKEQSKLKVQ